MCQNILQRFQTARSEEAGLPLQVKASTNENATSPGREWKPGERCHRKKERYEKGTTTGY